MVVSARRKEKIEAVVKEISDAGGDALAVTCDITSVDSVDALVKAALEKYRKVNAAFLNSGAL